MAGKAPGVGATTNRNRRTKKASAGEKSPPVYYGGTASSGKNLLDEALDFGWIERLQRARPISLPKGRLHVGIVEHHQGPDPKGQPE